MTRILAAGSRALLVELPDLETVLQWHAHLSAHPLYGQIETVPATSTLLVITDSAQATRKAAATLRTFDPAGVEAAKPKQVHVPVVYDGEDLADAAAAAGMSVEALIDWHTGTVWRGGFGGFAPGFTYCVTDGPAARLSMPRRDSPRTAVPAGAVGLAGEFSAVYPRRSPGGWQLIGTTVAPMWDSLSDPPARIQPGDEVRYQAVREHVEVSDISRVPASMVPRRPTLKLQDAGLNTTIQDGGRHGFARLGVTTSGFLDRASASVANRVVGNATTAAVLENIGGLRLSSLVDTVVAVTGADATVRINGARVPLGSPQLLPAASHLEVEPPVLGARNYVAVRGGIVVPPELGSVSTDVLSGLGPQPLAAGALIHTPTRLLGTVNLAEPNPLRVETRQGTTHGVIRVNAGPRDDWFTLGTAALTEQVWEVTPQSNRVGLRLRPRDGRHTISRSVTAELPSEGLVAGAVQVPPSGEPVLFLRDHAVTGGYPVIATVYDEDLDVAAQLPPGSTVSFVLAPSPIQE